MDSPGSSPSAPLSPATTMTSTHSDNTTAMPNNDQPQPSSTTVANSLDDVFGSSPPALSNVPPTETAPEPSELPSLRRQHVTTGYREGISDSKGQHVQDGFDAGFPIGAQLGMRTGTILGILEGVLRGYESRAGSAVVKKQVPSTARGGPTASSKESESEAQKMHRQGQKERVLKIHQHALKELEVQSVFGIMEDNGDREQPEAQLARKGNGVISKWEDRVRLAHWEENMGALEMKEAQKKGNGDAEQS